MHHQIEANRRSIEDPNDFWLPIAKNLISWTKPPTVALKSTKSDGPSWGPWFPDGELSTCYNLIDRHPPTDIAILYESPVTGISRKYTYGELRDEVETMAGVLNSMGIKRGDTVIIFMPMIPEALVSMYACTKLGAIHSVVFGGFAASELAKRIEDSKAKAIISASCGIEKDRTIPYKPLVDKAFELSSHKPDYFLLLQREKLRSDRNQNGVKLLDMENEMASIRASGKQFKENISIKSEEFVYLLYTSGTTGKPKGVIREAGGHAVQLAFTMEFIFGIRRGDVIFTASDIGWVVGHAYIVYAPLLVGATTVLYEGKPVGTPDASAFWRIVEKHKVNALFTAPTALRAVRREDPEAKHVKSRDLSSLRAIFLAGERSEPSIVQFYSKVLAEIGNAKIIDNYWSTEIGSPITALSCKITNSILDIKPGSAGTPMPGMNVHVVDDAGKELQDGEFVNIVLKTPLAPTAFRTVS